jgi:hypothetical protein
LTVSLTGFSNRRLSSTFPPPLTALSPLRRYARKRTVLFPQAQAFFVSDRGQKLQYGAVNRKPV